MTREEAYKIPIIQHIIKLDGEFIGICFKKFPDQKDLDRQKKIHKIFNFYYNRHPQIWNIWEQLKAGKI